MTAKELLVAATLLAATSLAACGGGGGSSIPQAPGSTPTPPSIPGTSQMNSYTSYTVYQGVIGAGTYIEVMPLNVAPGTLQNAQPVPGAIVQYPDGSEQIADVLGNFDASQSSWAQANLSQVLSNPNLEPEILVSSPANAQIQPADAFVQIYSGSSNTVTAGKVRMSSPAASDELASVAVFPRGYSMFDAESRVYHAIGVNSAGTFMSLGSASVQWSLTVPQGCANGPAGKITPTTNDPTRAVYTPPSSGTFPSGCQDEVVATAGANGASYSGSGNAFYYDPSAGATLTGQLTDSTGKAVAGGIVDLYGGGREFYHGKLYAVADANGKFTRIVPPNRSLYPFAGNPVTTSGKTKYTFFAVNPSTVSITGVGTTVTQNLAETATQAVNPFKPLPPLERAIRDSWIANDIATDGVPFGGAQSGGTFASGSFEYIISNPGPANASGTVQSGAYKNWTYVWDSTGKIVVFQQPNTQEGGRHVLQVTTGLTTMQYGGACPSGDMCYNFIQYYNPSGFAAQPSPLTNTSLGSGSILATDGSFATNVTSTQFTVSPFTRNVYSVGHQTPGSPLYVHNAQYTQTPGSATLSVSDTWQDASGHQLASYSGTRTQGTAPVLFTYSGQGTRTYYKPDGTQAAQVAFSLTNATLNTDHSGTFGLVYNSGLPNASDNGTTVIWTLNPPSSTTRATGVVTNPNITGLQTNNVATFSVTNALVVTVTMDPNLGGNVITFHL